jgi:hypothetical protein
MTIERNVTSSSTKASPNTNANTIGACDFIESLKSRDPAVNPVTCASAFSMRPIVDGMTEPRSASSARFDAASVPSPASGIRTRAARREALMSTVIGSCIRPVASAARLSAAIPAVTSGVVTSGALTATIAGCG